MGKREVAGETRGPRFRGSGLAQQPSPRRLVDRTHDHHRRPEREDSGKSGQVPIRHALTLNPDHPLGAGQRAHRL